MGIRTRGLDIKVGAKQGAADKAVRAEAQAVIERWNERLAASRDMLWSPTIRAALIAGTPWLDVTAQAVGRAARLIFGSRSSPAGVGRHARARAALLHGARNRRRCRGSSGYMPCRLRRRPQRRTCDRALG
jgi:hypothetical protein